MVGKLLLVLYGLASLSQVNSNDLPNQSHQVTLRDVIAQIRNTDIPGETVRFFFPNSEETFSTLNQLLTTRNNLEVSEVLDVFNYNFGAKVFVVNGDFIQVDPNGYQRFLSSKALSLARSLYPKNIFQQYWFYGVLQREIQRATENIRPVFDTRKVPVRDVTALIRSDAHKVAKRDLLSSMGEVVCDYAVDASFQQLNQSLTSTITFLNTVSVADDTSLIATLIDFVIDLAKSFVAVIRDVAEAYTESICGNIFNPTRRRRDLTSETSVAEFGTRDIATRDIFGAIFGTIWSLISSIVNPFLLSIVDGIIWLVNGGVTAFLEGPIKNWAYGLVNSTFPA